MPLAPGDVFAGYTIVRTLGSGGMGAVHLARHPRLPRTDALKVLHPEHSADPAFAARFRREADLVARLSHRNVVPVLDRGEDEGRLWLTMPYVAGTDAEAALAEAGGLLPAERAVRIVGEVAAALDAAHRQGLVHRDVKPANVLLAPGEDGEPEQVFLTDFGIAKALDGSTVLTRTGMVLATFEYASPEQIESRPLDARSDGYSLGCLLYRLLTGQVPYPGVSVLASLHGHLTAPPPRPTAVAPWLPPGLDDVVARAMARDPAGRFPTCRDLAAAAAAALADLPPAPPPPYRVALGAGPGAPTRTGSTDVLSAAETARLTDLVRRTRFFDLPAALPGDLPDPRATTTGRTAPDPVTIEIASSAGTRRVVADLAHPVRPPDLDDLVALLGRCTARAPVPVPRPRAAAPTTVTSPAAPRSTPRAPLPPPPARRPLPVPPDLPPPGGAPAPARTPDRAPGRATGRGRWVVAGVVAAVVAASGGTVWLLGRETGTDAGTGSGTASTAPADPDVPPAEAALAALPRAAALPEGTLVVSRDVEGAVDLYTVDVATGAVGARLTTADGAELSAVVSPDRSTVVYWREGPGGPELRAVATDGSGDRPLFPAPPEGCALPGRPAWDPADPTRLALACADDGAISLHVVGLDGAVGPELAAAPGLGDPVFSPDGGTVVYWAGEEAGRDGGSLYAVPAEGGGEPVRLTDEDLDADPAFSPDGSTVALRRGLPGGQRGIAVIGADGSGPRLVTQGAFDQDPVFSPDGAVLAFKSNRSGSDQLWTLPVDGGPPRQVPGAVGGLLSAPAWGPPA